jgi:hypothetical protein
VRRAAEEQTQNPERQAVFAVFQGSGEKRSVMEPRGIEPLTRSAKCKIRQQVTPTAPSGLPLGLPLTAQNDPDLARVVEAWPVLPEAIKAGILAMVNTAKKTP